MTLRTALLLLRPLAESAHARSHAPCVGLPHLPVLRVTTTSTPLVVWYHTTSTLSPSIHLPGPRRSLWTCRGLRLAMTGETTTGWCAWGVCVCVACIANLQPAIVMMDQQ